MTIKLCCDICDQVIPLKHGSGPEDNVGRLKLEFGEYGGQHLSPPLIDIEVICEQCTAKIKLAVQHTIEEVKKMDKGGKKA